MVRKKCHFCGKTFYTKGQNNRKYCSDRCRKEARNDRNGIYQLTRCAEKKERSFGNIKDKIQSGKLPLEFNQDDTLYRYTTTADLSENPIKKNNGEIDFEKELKRIRKEKKKFNLK